MFQGPSAIRLDAKGRLNMPTRYRDALLAQSEGKVIFTKHPDGCLLMFPQAEWATFRANVSALPFEADRWRRMFLGNAMEVEMDGTGRVLIPPVLREAAGLQKDVLMLGMDTHFEIWDKALNDANEAALSQAPRPDSVRNLTYGAGHG